MEYRKKIVLRFTSKTWDKPIVYRLARDYGLEFNILKAIVLPKQESLMVLELAGTEENYHRGVEYLLSRGIKVEPIESDILRDEQRCVHCGACTAVCPTGALSIKRDDMEVVFDPERCVACEQCLRACPVRAMRASF
ncbi:MAG: (Fe-S)-binding protein [Deltaproteobacteria bacterium]|nr:MAG: (Fe-S)-binding protein [Deltaproteobacteria bacterium]HEX15555.1 4Fe-4S dicluster domain-containing protein [Deltaproteobacteria bacterium]